jgi:hypothetical protein
VRPVSKKNAERFWRACAELGLRAELGFTVTLPGAVLYPFARICDLGAPKGMLLFTSSSEMKGQGEALVERGYGYSVLSEPRDDEEFDIDTFQEVFRDWGWSGEPDNAPSWIG